MQDERARRHDAHALLLELEAPRDAARRVLAEDAHGALERLDVEQRANQAAEVGRGAGDGRGVLRLRDLADRRQRLVDDAAHALELERPRRVVLDAEVGQPARAEPVGVREVDAVADRADHDLGRAAADVDDADLALPGLVERVERADPGQPRLLVLVDDLELVPGVGEHARGELLPVLGLARRGRRDDAQVGRAELARDAAYRRSPLRAALGGDAAPRSSAARRSRAAGSGR